WRPQGLVSVGIGSRFLRGADVMVTEGVVGEDLFEITDRAIHALQEWAPHLLLVVYYVADSAGHLYGPEAPETLAAIEAIDGMAARLLVAYAEKGFLDSTVVTVLADHGMMQVEQVAPKDWGANVGALTHGRVALIPQRLSDEQLNALRADPLVETIYGRTELERLRAWGPSWGEHVVLLKEGCMFKGDRPMRGYHGAWSPVEQRIPLILSGAGIRAGSRLESCEIIDIAPTLSTLLGGDVPAQSEGRVLWEALDTEKPR
ncbi:MAG: alkaline phosphatase family protein, partial [Anaerolineae bacterium]